MFNDDDLHAIQLRLEAELAVLEGDADYRRSSAETVMLDQTRTGRLSRMDALQGQAMAHAAQARAAQQALRIKAALRRLEEGSYGDCVQCDEPIAVGRLDADPAAAACITCAEKAER